MLRSLAILAFFCVVLIFSALGVIVALVADLRKRWGELLQAIKAIPQQTAPIPKPKVVVLRLPATDSEEEFCKCGVPGCLGHEEREGKAIFPGFTSEAVMAKVIQDGSKIIRIPDKISHVQDSK